MDRLNGLSLRHGLSDLALMAVLLMTGCDRQAATQSTDAVPGEVRTFTGRWSATGTRQTMHLEPGHHADIIRVSGSMLLKGKQRLRKGFKADLIGFADNKGSLVARSVWTDDRNDKVFSELHGDAKIPGQLIEGRFLGGTGPYAGVSGEYSFRWKRLIDSDNGTVSGRVEDLQGWARLGVTETLSPAGLEQQ